MVLSITGCGQPQNGRVDAAIDDYERMSKEYIAFLKQSPGGTPTDFATLTNFMPTMQNALKAIRAAQEQGMTESQRTRLEKIVSEYNRALSEYMTRAEQ